MTCRLQWAIMVDFDIFKIMLVLSSIFRFILSDAQNMNTKLHKNKRGIRIRRIYDNRSEDSLLNSESDEDHSIAFTRRRINIIKSDDKFICFNFRR